MHSVVITALVVTDCSMFCRMLCSDAQCCYNSFCGYRLFPCFVVCVVMYSVCYNSSCGYRLFPCFVCCVVMHSVVITAPVVTDCSHVLSHVV